MRRNDIFWSVWYFAIVLWLLLMYCQGAKAQALFMNKPFGMVQYDPALRIPRMVEWIITPRDLRKNAGREGMRFRIDPEVPTPRATTSDYIRSGYQRGHMCPAADRTWRRDIMASTFLMSNICPQAPSLNVGRWKATESICRGWAQVLGSCTVRVAPLFLFRDTAYLGKNKVAVPHAFFKIAWSKEHQRILGMWIMLNE